MHQNWKTTYTGKATKYKNSKGPLNISTFLTAGPSKMYSKSDSWYENTCTIWQPWS
jgi:hypothetical protein